jgi:UDP-N-acetylmuramyl pentapeptide phosphotransferase/UDP-N-acetylglucosamine-1-phosphate transferase
MTLMLPLGVFLLALAAGMALTGWLLPRLVSARVLDLPNARSLHVAPVPRGGGLAIALVVLLTQVVLIGAGLWRGQAALVLTLVAAAFAALGWADDRASRSVALRFALQALLSALFVALALPATLSLGVQIVLWLAVMWGVNLFNFMDGADGFAAVQTIAAGLGLAVLFSVTGQGGSALACCALAGAAAGFLRWNWHPARIFLGDVGSYFIGFELAALICLSGDGARVPWPALILVAPFVSDASWTLLARALRGVPVWHAHREHLYQRLVLHGWSPARLGVVLGAMLVLLCWPAAALAMAYGVTPALFVYGLLVIIWLWVRRVLPLPRR